MCAAVVPAELRGLDEEMEVIHAPGFQSGQVELFERLQDLQRRQSARRRRRGEHTVAAVIDRQRLDDRRPIAGKVFFGEDPAVGLHLANDRPWDVAFIEGRRPLGRKPP